MITNETMMPFVAGCETSRLSLNHPFLQGDKVFATNGKIAVWCNAEDYFGIAPVQQSRPSMDAIVNAFIEPEQEWDGFIPHCSKCNDTGAETLTECAYCGGNGKCPECNGQGESECDCCGSIVDCEECTNGACDECGGTGKADPEQIDCEACKDGRIEFGNVRLSWLIARKLPRPLRWCQAGGIYTEALSFRSGHMMGIAMGVIR